MVLHDSHKLITSSEAHPGRLLPVWLTILRLRGLHPNPPASDRRRINQLIAVQSGLCCSFRSGQAPVLPAGWNVLRYWKCSMQQWFNGGTDWLERSGPATTVWLTTTHLAGPPPTDSGTLPTFASSLFDAIIVVIIVLKCLVPAHKFTRLIVHSREVQLPGWPNTFIVWRMELNFRQSTTGGDRCCTGTQERFLRIMNEFGLQ